MRSFNHFKISEVADFLGMSQQTIRYYEEMGVVKPMRDQSNGYRYYNVLDINVLILARQFRALGLSVTDAAQALNNLTPGKLIEVMREKYAALEKQIAISLKTMEFIEDVTQHITSLQFGEILHRKRPGMYAFFFRKHLAFLKDPYVQPRIREWMEYLPLAEHFLEFLPDSFPQGDGTYLMGLCIEEKFAEPFDLHNEEGVQYIPPKDCLYTVIEQYSEHLALKDSLKSIFPYMQEHRYFPDGACYGRSRISLDVVKDPHYYVEIWVPYKQMI